MYTLKTVGTYEKGQQLENTRSCRIISNEIDSAQLKIPKNAPFVLFDLYMHFV